MRNIKLRYPHLPCVLAGQRPIPVEILRVVGGQQVWYGHPLDADFVREAMPGFYYRLFAKAQEHFYSPPTAAAQTVAEFGLYFWDDNAHLVISPCIAQVSTNLRIRETSA